MHSPLRPAPLGRQWICSFCTARFSSSSSLLPQNVSRPYGTTPRRLPRKPARTRFAPSPTGYLHLGSLRTALFNFLLARATGGQFLLRIEDTDRKRTIPDAEERMCHDLRWAGLQWDEGPGVGGQYGPYRQSERTALYRQHADKLLRTGHAYRCFCSAERLNALATQRNQLGLPTDYDRTCLAIPSEQSQERAANGEAHVVRLKVPEQYPDFTDLVYGNVGKQSKTGVLLRHGEPAFEDPVLLKSDGLPTYHLANVVDDHHMKITHVVRAAEWMSSTPKHLVMYDAFGWEPPAFAHVGLLQDQDRQKLSKRKFDLSIRTFEQELGIFPEALINYVALLGWSHSQKSDVFSLQQLIDNFDMKFTKGNTIVTFGKLWHLQRNFAQRYAEEGGTEFDSIVNRIHSLAARYGLDREIDGGPPERDLKEYIALIFRADAKNFTTVEDFCQRSAYFFKPIVHSGLEPSHHSRSIIHGVPILKLAEAAETISQVPNESWNTTPLHNAIFQLVISMTEVGALSDNHLKAGQTALDLDQRGYSKALYSYLRWALAGGMPGPGVADIMTILGRRVTLSRLRDAAESVRGHAAGGVDAEVLQNEAIVPE